MTALSSDLRFEAQVLIGFYPNVIKAYCFPYFLP